MGEKVQVHIVVHEFTLNFSNPCDFGLGGTINTCGHRTEGRDYPMCGKKDPGRCPQVVVTTSFLTPEQYRASKYNKPGES